MNPNEQELREHIHKLGYPEPTFCWPRVTRHAGNLACDVYFLPTNKLIKFVKMNHGWTETSQRQLTTRERRKVKEFTT